jgi:predicted DNA-binding ribbon-helix-helix protein
MALFRNMESRNLNIEGKRTSIALEAPFWKEVDLLATSDNLSWQQWISNTLKRSQGGRASSIRVSVLKRLKKKSQYP